MAKIKIKTYKIKAMLNKLNQHKLTNILPKNRIYIVIQNNYKKLDSVLKG